MVRFLTHEGFSLQCRSGSLISGLDTLFMASLGLQHKRRTPRDRFIPHLPKSIGVTAPSLTAFTVALKTILGEDCYEA